MKRNFRRYFPRFRLLTLFAGISAVCAWLAVEANAARRQERAVQAIRAAGGDVFYDFQVGDPGKFLFDGPKWTSTFRDIVGIDLACRVVAVDLLGAAVVDADLTILRDLEGVASVTLDGSNVTGNAVPYLLEIPSLREVHLAKGQMTDAEVAPLRERGIAVISE